MALKAKKSKQSPPNKLTTIDTDKYTFREAKESDFLRIASFFSKHGYGYKNQRWLRWKYLENPRGRGRIFLMENSEKAIKGTLGYIPHIILCAGGTSVPVFEAVDLFFAPDARSKRMFPIIQRNAMKLIQSPLVAFPNKRAQKITVELGWKKSGTLQKWYFPIGVNKDFAKGLMKLFFTIIDGLARIYSYFWLRGWDNKIELVPADQFERDFDTIHNDFWIGRTADFLNWRFLNNPLQRYAPFEFHMNGNVIGFCILCEEADAAEIYDFFVLGNERACIQRLVDYLRLRGFNRLVFRGVGLKLWKFGFFRLFPKLNLLSHNLTHKPHRITLADSDW